MIGHPFPSFAAEAPSATTSVASASSSWYRASCAVSAGLTGVTAAPRRQAANMLVTSSTRFCIMIARTSPRPSPASASRAAAAATAVANCVLSSVWRSSARHGPRGFLHARWSGNAAVVAADMAETLWRRRGAAIGPWTRNERPFRSVRTIPGVGRVASSRRGKSPRRDAPGIPSADGPDESIGRGTGSGRRRRPRATWRRAVRRRLRPDRPGDPPAARRSSGLDPARHRRQ